MRTTLIITILSLSAFLFGGCGSVSRSNSLPLNFTIEKINTYELKVTGIQNAKYFYLKIPVSEAEETFIKKVESLSVLCDSRVYHFKYIDCDIAENRFSNFSKLASFSLINSSRQFIKVTGINEIIIKSSYSLNYSKVLIGTTLNWQGNSYGTWSKNNCYLSFKDFSFGDKTKTEIENQKISDEKTAKALGFSSVEDYYADLQQKEIDKNRITYKNFYQQVLYNSGIPLKKDDVFIVKATYLQIIDRVSTLNGYTYLATIISTAAEDSIDYARGFGAYGGGFRKCFYIISKTPLNLKESYEFTTKTHYVTNKNPLKIKYISKSQYQRNYQDVDCYVFSFLEETTSLSSEYENLTHEDNYSNIY